MKRRLSVFAVNAFGVVSCDVRSVKKFQPGKLLMNWDAGESTALNTLDLGLVILD